MLLTLKDVAKELSCTYETARFIVERGDILSIQITQRNIRIDPKDLEDYISRKQNEANQCKQQRIQKQGATKSASVIQMESNNNSRQQRISQRALRNVRQTK